MNSNVGCYFISPAHLKANFAIIIAIISLIIAAATIVPDTILASEASIVSSVVVAIHVKTKDTPECGSSVNPKYFVTGPLV